MKIKVCLLVFFCSGWPAISQPQNIASGIRPQFVKHFPHTAGVSAFIIGLTGYDVGNGSPQWSFCFGSNASCTPNSAAPNTPITLMDNLTIQFSSTGTLGATISGSSSVSGEFYLRIRVDSPLAGNFGERVYFVVIRSPVDVVFVLDRSGSMECAATENTETDWPACVTNGPSATRWSVLQTCINNFVSKLDDHHTITNDKFGVVYFSRNITTGSEPIEFTDISNFRTRIAADMSTPPIQNTSPPVLARNGTSLGEGLFEAINDRYSAAATTGRRQLILLFTDGEQNGGKWVKSSGTNVGKIITQSQTNTTQVLNLNAATIADIQVYTAGTQVAGQAADLLQYISEGPGFFYVMPGHESEFGSDLASHAFNEIYNQASPQFIRFEKKDLDTAALQFSVTANKGVNRLFFEAYFNSPTAEEYKYTIEKDGVDVTPSSTGNFISRYVARHNFDFNELTGLTPEGSWTFTIHGPAPGQTPGNVSFFATADDHNIRFAGKVAQPTVSVGMKMRPTVELFANGAPVADADVRAIIKKPGDDLGDLLARAPVPSFPPKTPETGTCGAQKYSYLKVNQPSALGNLYNVNETTIALAHDGNGVYSGTFDDVDVSGIYKIVYLIKVNSPDLGFVERMKEQTVNVRFAPPVLNPQAKRVSRLKQDTAKAVVVKPYYRIKGRTRYVGPGFEHAFGVFDANVQLENVADNCDGSYRLTFSGDPDTRIQLYLVDGVIYEGKLKNIERPIDHRLSISVHSGLTFPYSDLDLLYERGTYIGGDIGYQLTRTFSIEGRFGQYNFKEDFTIRASTVYVRANIPAQPSGFFFDVGAGAGIYTPDENDSETGYSISSAFNKRIAQRWVLSIDGAYHSISGLDYSFGTLGLGLRYSL